MMSESPKVDLTPAGKRALAVSELYAVATEMRNRKINHGRSTSPTLEAWAERICHHARRIEENLQ